MHSVWNKIQNFEGFLKKHPKAALNVDFYWYIQKSYENLKLKNYRSNITNLYVMCNTLTYWAIPEKKWTGHGGRGWEVEGCLWGIQDIIFCKPPLEFLGFLLYPWKLQTKQSFTPRNSTKLCYTPQKFWGLKPRLLKIPLDFFLITPINPWKIHLLFLQYPWKFHILNPVCYFSGIVHFIYWKLRVSIKGR